MAKETSESALYNAWTNARWTSLSLVDRDVSGWGGGGELSAEGKQNLTRFKTTWSPRACSVFAQDWSPCAAGPCPLQREVLLHDREQESPPPPIFEDPPFKSKTLTRKLPFAQVLGFALLAARHVGFVAALQLSSHWEIRSYKVDSKWSVFIDVSDIQREEQNQPEWSVAHADSEEERAADCADLFMTFSPKECDGGATTEPPELQVQVRTWRSCELERQETDGLRHTQHGQGDAGQWEGGRAIIKTNGHSLWTTYGKRLERDGGDPEDTNGRRASGRA